MTRHRPDRPRVAAVVLAAGAGRRVGAETNKVLLPLLGLPVLAHSVRTILDVAGVHRIVLVVRPEERDVVAGAVAPELGSHDVWLVDGGAERHHSEWAALQALAPEIEAEELDVVALHDAARPLATAGTWRAVLDAAATHGGALPITRTSGILAADGVPLPDLVAVQTPQAFRAAPLLEAYRQAEDDGFLGTDTASCLERYRPDLAVVGVDAGPANLKVTYPEDLALAAELLAARPR